MTGCPSPRIIKVSVRSYQLEVSRWANNLSRTPNYEKSPEMASTAKTYLRALQVLSDDIDLSTDRKALLSGMEMKESLIVALPVVSTMLPRCDKRSIYCLR